MTEATEVEVTQIDVSQRARDAVADYRIKWTGLDDQAANRIKDGLHDRYSLVQAFARFERDIRQSPVPVQGELVPPQFEHLMIDGYFADRARATHAPTERERVLLEALKACRAQFDFYAAVHRKAEKHEKARTNEKFAFICSEAITQAQEPSNER
jgi:hypothetical protein